eukprot:TRINITY_DN591_c0_g1_i1.p1 TRINITY_DN591_c0_g1~~TRINITY_DN591_c0_g1_i1.p1  ORF type:complete len:209 (-),score=19.92 TRINITY_DN591_c0_g1_i1:116-691(-)
MTTCQDCEKSFGSKNALRQHCVATGHIFVITTCPDCQRSFGSKHALQQHSDATGHGSAATPSRKKQFKAKTSIDQHRVSVSRRGTYVPDPPVDSAGQWVPRAEFEGRKSFGYFICRCRHTWVSAHSFKLYKQGCQRCERQSLPNLMWVNEYDDDRESREGRTDGPHDEQRCEACRRGVCQAERRTLPRRFF